MSQPGPSPALFFDTVNAFQRTEALRAAVDLVGSPGTELEFAL